MIHLRDIRKSFGKSTAVDGLSLDVYSGEVFGLLGPNGAGKTTTISIATGLLAADAGTGGSAPARGRARRARRACGRCWAWRRKAWRCTTS